MDVAYAFLNHHHSIWINGEQFCIWHSYFIDNMQNLFTYTHIDCLIYRKGEKNDAKNAPFTWTRTEPKAENLVQLIESKVSFVVPFNSDCELRLCRARFSQESLGMFSELRGIGHRLGPRRMLPQQLTLGCAEPATWNRALIQPRQESQKST